MKKAILLFYFLSLVLVASAQISGRVLAGEQGVEGVAVQAYNSQNRMVANTNTSTTGEYHMPIAKGERVRVVVQAPFTLVPALRSSLVLLAQNPTVLPITQLYNPAQYTSKNPPVAVPLYLNGNHQSKATDSLPAIVLSSFSNHKTLATQLAVGTVWGLAHNNKRGLVYSSAFLKRHAGLGKADAAGLYVSNLKTNQTRSLTQLKNWNTSYGEIKFINANSQVTN